jgi:MYXO-CTERM domain-containing protein
VTVLGGVFVPLALRSVGLVRVEAVDTVASVSVTAGVASAPVLFLLPLVAGLAARRRRPEP